MRRILLTERCFRAQKEARRLGAIIMEPVEESLVESSSDKPIEIYIDKDMDNTAELFIKAQKIFNKDKQLVELDMV